MPLPPDHRRIHDLAASQCGIVARRQLGERGVGRRLIEHWLSTGRLHRVFAGVYAIGRPATGHRAIWMAATLRGGPGAALSGVAAAAAWDLMAPQRSIEASRPAGRRTTFISVPPHRGYRLVVRRASLLETDVTTRGPVPVMTPSRTLIDLAKKLGERDLRRVFLGAGRSGLLTPGCLAECTARGASFEGHRRLMSLVDQWLPETGRLRSHLESEFLLPCGRYRIPAPRTNFRLGGYEVDCFWPGSKLIVELDGRTFHDDGFGFEDDREKGNALTGRGYTVLRFTYRMVTESPETVARTLLPHLAADG